MEYKIKFADNQGDAAVDAYSQTIGGNWYSTVDGLAFVTVPDDQGEIFEAEFEADENVIGYWEC